jgi:hypothetical protein
MKVRIQVIVEDDEGQVLDSHDVFSFQRKHLRSEQVGLTLAELPMLFPFTCWAVSWPIRSISP